jgi:hypothetical protein
MKNGQLIEYQVTWAELHHLAKTYGHKIFEKWRSVNDEEIARRSDEYGRDAYKSHRMYQEGWDGVLARLGLDPMASHASAINFARSLVSITGEKLAPSSIRTMPFAHTPSGERIAEKEGSITQTDPSVSRATMESSRIMSTPPDSIIQAYPDIVKPESPRRRLLLRGVAKGRDPKDTAH